MALGAIHCGMFANKRVGRIHSMGELQFLSGPAGGGMTLFASGRELRMVLVLMTIRAMFGFKPEIVNSGGNRSVRRDRSVQLFVAVITFHSAVLALQPVAGKVVVEFFAERRDDRIGSDRMLAMAGPAFPFESAVVTGQVRPSFADIHMALLAIGIGNLSGIGMAFGAGFGQWTDPVAGGQFVRADTIRKFFRKCAADGSQPGLMKSQGTEAGKQDGDHQNYDLHFGKQQFLTQGFPPRRGMMGVSRSGQA